MVRISGVCEPPSSVKIRKREPYETGIVEQTFCIGRSISVNTEVFRHGTGLCQPWVQRTSLERDSDWSMAFGYPNLYCTMVGPVDDQALRVDHELCLHSMPPLLPRVVALPPPLGLWPWDLLLGGIDERLEAKEELFTSSMVLSLLANMWTSLGRGCAASQAAPDTVHPCKRCSGRGRIGIPPA